MSEWLKSPVRGVLLDITGVLYESGDGYGSSIKGSAEAFARLKATGCPVRLITNESTTSTDKMLEKLLYHGISIVPKELFSPIPAVKSLIDKYNLRPHLVVHPNVRGEFDSFSNENPTCVVLGDSEHEFSFANINEAFRVLMQMEQPLLYSMGKGKYYRHEGKLQVDVGAFTAALEFACDINAKVIGKPSPEYFGAALEDIGISPHEVKATVWLPANFLFGIPSTSVIFQTTFRFYVPPNIPIPLNNFGFVLLGRDGSGHKRIDLFKQIENFYLGFGLNGVQCSLRTICEVAELPFDHGLIGEIINFLFALTASPNEINSTSPITPDNYREAKELGEQRGDCWSAYPECDMSFLDWISAI